MHLAAVTSHPTANFTEIKSILESLLTNLVSKESLWSYLYPYLCAADLLGPLLFPPTFAKLRKYIEKSLFSYFNYFPENAE